MASPRQHLIILWKWKHLTAHDGNAYHAIPVHSTKGRQLLHQLHQRGKNELHPLMQRLLTANPSDEYLLLLHQSAFGREDLSELLGSLSNTASVRAHFFGGGSDYLYYDATRNSGFLEQHGDLAHRKFYDGVRSPDMLINGELDPVRFKQVWRYYFFQCKRRLYENKVHVLRHLTGVVLYQHHLGTVQNLLQATQPYLLDQLQKVLQEISEQYAEEGSSISGALTNLQLFIEKKEISQPADLHELNTLFATLLDNILEPTY